MKEATSIKYTVVLHFYVDGIRAEDWTQFIDSPTRAGASKKAAFYLKDTFYTPTNKSRIDNYEYWKCEDK